MCTLNDENDYSLEMDYDEYIQDYDNANPQIEEIEQEESDIAFE